MFGLWDETVKCFFLRIRDPPDSAIDDLVKTVFKIKELYSEKAKYVLNRTRTTLRDFRNKYNNSIVKLVDEYKSTRFFSYFFVFLLI